MSSDAADAATREALQTGGWADMRPAYRALLRRLKETDPAAFEEATERFASTVAPAIAAGDREPVSAWAGYGAWLAARLGGGRLVRIDGTGLATADDVGPEPGHVLLFLPEASRESAIPILQPADPSPAQEAALELLTR